MQREREKKGKHTTKRFNSVKIFQIVFSLKTYFLKSGRVLFKTSKTKKTKKYQQKQERSAEKNRKKKKHKIKFRKRNFFLVCGQELRRKRQTQNTKK